MTKKILSICTLLMVLVATTFAQTLSTATNSTNVPATDFGKSIIKAYFSNECSMVYDKLATEIMNMENGQKIQKSTFTMLQFCAESPLRTDIRVNYSMYLKYYSPEVLNHLEFAAKYPQFQEIYQLQSGDFYFNGANLNNGATELFKAADMATFILRKVPKTTHQFQIIGM